MERGCVEGLKLYRTGDVEDPLLCVARDELGDHHVPRVRNRAEDCYGQTDDKHDRGLLDDLGHCAKPISAGNRCQHVAASEDRDDQTKSGSRLKSRHEEKLPTRRSPDELQRLRREVRQSSQRDVRLRTVEIVNRERLVCAFAVRLGALARVCSAHPLIVPSRPLARSGSRGDPRSPVYASGSTPFAMR
jgi:hypothetical protein